MASDDSRSAFRECIPHNHLAVLGAADNMLATRTIRDAQHPSRVACEPELRFAVRDSPGIHKSVISSATECGAIRTECQCPHLAAAIAGDNALKPSRTAPPDSNAAIVTGCGNQAAIGAERHCAHLVGMTENRLRGPTRQIPHSCDTIPPGTGKTPAIRAERHSPNPTRVSLQRLSALAGI